MKSICYLYVILALTGISLSLNSCTWCDEWKSTKASSDLVKTIDAPTQSQIPQEMLSVDSSNKENEDKEKEDFVNAFLRSLEAMSTQPDLQTPDTIQGKEEPSVAPAQEFSEDSLADLLKNMQNFLKSDASPDMPQQLFEKADAKDFFNHFSIQESLNKEAIEGAAKKFYKAYLSRFYPKALVIQDYFFDMCPCATLGAFNEFIKMLTDKTWFVFKNRSEHFKKSEHWDLIIQECKHLSTCLSEACVDQRNNKIVKRTFEKNKRDLIPLVDYWKSEGVTSFYDFYAYYADYIKRMFNEAIIFENIGQGARFSKMYDDNLKNIPESLYDGSYHEHQKVNKELLARLRKNLGFGNYDDSFDSFMGQF